VINIRNTGAALKNSVSLSLSIFLNYNLVCAQFCFLLLLVASIIKVAKKAKNSSFLDVLLALKITRYR